MRLAICLVLFAAGACAQFENLPIGSIDFYGLEGLDAQALSAAVSVHPGDRFEWPGTRDRIRREVAAAAGRPVTGFTPVCCDRQSRLLLYVGLSRNQVTHSKKPAGDCSLDAELVALYTDAMRLLPESLKFSAGKPEDYSQGYSQSAYEPMRAIQMRMRQAALDHENVILRVLRESADDSHRAAAAMLAGYTRQSPDQIAALIKGSLDSNDTVRNNATRSLGVLAWTPQFAKGIPAEPFIDKLNSPVWSDRNKGLMLLTALTRDEDPAVLAEIESKALPALREMAAWHFDGHADGPRLLLRRIEASRSKRPAAPSAKP